MACYWRSDTTDAMAAANAITKVVIPMVVSFLIREDIQAAHSPNGLGWSDGWTPTLLSVRPVPSCLPGFCGTIDIELIILVAGNLGLKNGK